MKKNGYLRKFIAMFLVFVMLMADSSMTTFADVVGRSVQQNAVEDEENGIDLQSADDVNVTVTAPDGTYYVKLKQKENEWWTSDIASASVQVQNGKGTCSLDGSNLNDSKENWLEIGLQENGSFVKSGEVLRSEGKIYSVTESNHAFTVNEISIQPGTQRNFKDILGSATNFGIVANEATFKGHLESNFAIGKLNYKGSNVQMSKNEGGGAGYNYIGEFVGSSQLQIGLNGNAGGSVVYAGKGAEGKLTTDNSDLLIDYDTYTEAQIKKIVKDMVDTIKTTSTTLYNENSVPYSAVTDISTSGNQYTDINIAKYGKDAGTYYVSFQPGEFNTFMSNPNRRITIREDQNIVLNVPDTNVDFRQFTFVIVDASGNVVYQKTTNANSDEDRVAENVIFNCPNATTAATYTSTGIFLVPNATFTNAIVSAGWVIANTIAAIGGQEWHNVYKGMPVVETTFQIKATKNVDNAPATDEKYDGKFSFELQEKDGENWKTIDSVTNTGSAIVFDNLGKFGTEGTHYYKIVETASALSDVTIDGEPVYVKAVIKKNGNKMVATVTYYSDENYATEVSDPSFNNTTVITEKTEVSVEKKWADNENQDRVRPGSIQVQLYADETAQGEPIELNEDNGWKYTWSNLEKKSGSNDIEYTVDEVSEPAGYTKTVTVNEARTSYVITNTHTTETTEATVRKVWNDSNDQDGKRPISIIVNLLADGNATGTTVTLNEDNGWAATVNNLPKKANGTDIVYSWSEGNMPEGYSLTDTAKDGTVTTLTNSYSTEETSVSVRKVWTDSDNQDGIRPESISVQLKADGKASGDPVVLNEANNWTYTWTKLAKNANKTEIQYTVDEVDVPSGYTKTVTKESTGYVITNTHTTETTSINGTKTWSDNDNQDGKRPTSITVNLLANGTKVDSKEVTANDNWKYEFTNLPKYAAGNEITYTVEEDAVEGYEATVDGYNITNTHKPETTKVEGTKTWNDSDNQDGIRPDSITVNLFANGTKVDSKEVTANDNWKYSFTNLPKYAAGNEIIYTVSEELIDGYEASVNDYNITNTHETEKTEVSGIKSWDDNNNQDGIRPSKITVNLLADGTKVDSKEVTADNNWKYSFTDLPKYVDGKEIVYTVTEDAVEGYESTVNGSNILNTHIPETTEVSGTKTWNDANDQDGKRPESITVNLLANGEKVNSQVVTAAGNWTYNFTDLPKYKAGKEIKYKVEEVAVADYTTKVEGYDIYNTHTPETTSISGTKTWNDANDQDGKRPKSIKVNLLANGKVVQTKEVTAADNWSYAFNDLPIYEEGKVGQKLTYTISEEAVKDYTTVIDKTNITNSYTPGKIGVSVTKIWDDAGNQDGIRPEKITVKLLADGQDTRKTATLSVDNNWTQSITGLDEKKDGKAIEYTWAEENVPEGYELTGNTTKGTLTTLTNKHVPEVTSISGTKTWKDNDNQDGKRPTSITVNLLADGNVYDSKTVTATTNWTYAFDNLPVYENGQKITYAVSEDAVAGYETAIDGFNITNSYTPETTSVSGQKVWDDANNQDGKRPNSIKVRLLANGTEVATKDVTAADNWAYNFTDLPKYANGEEIVYTVTEDAVPDYTTAINGTTITNSYTPGKTSITVTKAWADNDNQDGIRPDSIKVQLYAGEDAQGEEVTLDGTNNWTYTWTGLDAKKAGQDIVYTVKEAGEVTGYTSEISGDAQTGFVITNTHKTEITSVEGKKVWDDADNQDGKRPESIKVRLLANGTEVATKDVTAADNWTYSFTDLPKFADGKEIVYTVTEDAVADYTTAIDGTMITNSYKPGKTSITVTKAWADNDNQDGIRPENIKVQLYAGETAQGEEVTLSADNNWTYTWSELDAKKDGQDIVYTVRETEVPAGYEAIVTGTAAEGFILTNTHETEVISVEGTKTWNDNDQTTKRPESITVRLLADGKEAGSQKVTADSNWTYKFTELPKYAAGKEIVYTVSEDAVPGYITSVNGNNLINTITSVKVSKVDITDHKELAGAHIQILDKDGNIIDEWDSTWEAHEVTGLKTNEQYTLRETVAPDGYTVTSDTTFTLKEDGTVDKDNTQTTVSDDGTLLVEDSKTSVKVSKVDIADGKELEGAHIQVIDEDENIVAEWDSTKEPHVIEGLKTDKKYILRETVAPTGYELTNDTTFVLKADGTVDTEKTTTVFKDGVLLVQDKLATGQSIAVTKKLTTITGDLRAMDQTFYVALYSDEACTQRVSDVKAIEFKNASSSTVVFNENIEVNKDYYIAECSQDGTAQSMGALADGTMYEAKFNNGNKATVKEANGTTTVYFDNVFSSIPDGYYKQGKLTITKKLLGADGNAKKSDNVFYAGIFDDADYTQLSTQVSQNIVKLDLAGGSEVSQVIKIGLDVNKTVTLYVTETDSNGKPVAGTSGFAYKVSVDGSTVIIDEANENASVTITNTENPTTTKTTKTTTEESGNESGSSASSHSMSSSTKAPKTGDDTPIAMYVIILIAAAALIVFGFEKRRRSNRK